MVQLDLNLHGLDLHDKKYSIRYRKITFVKTINLVNFPAKFSPIYG